jgi:co-chaperonin GroES (HSP10)
MNIKPLHKNVIIERQEKDLTTESGIILQTSDEADKSTVIAIGSDVEYVAVNDVVLVNWNKATKIDGKQYKINEEDIIAVFED